MSCRALTLADLAQAERGLLGFASPDEAAKKAADLLASWLNRWAPPEEGHGPALEPWEAKYLRARLKQWEKGSYGGLKALGKSDLDRARLYVSLRAAAEPACHAGEDEKVVLLRDDEASALSSSKEEREKQRDPFLERVLSHPGLPFLALEGEAGSGKTVLLQHVAYALACRHLNEPAPKSQLDEAGLAEGAPLLRIPILLEAKRLVEFLPEGELGELTDALVAALRKATDEPSVPADGAEGGRAGLRAGRRLVSLRRPCGARQGARAGVRGAASPPWAGAPWARACTAARADPRRGGAVHR